jgi:hypothetical protein
MIARVVVLAALAAYGCAARRHVALPPLEAYAGAGPLAVRGARYSDPGPAVVRALADDAAARRVLAARGEPETVEVTGGRGRVGRRVVLTYPAAGGKRRRVVLESGGTAPRSAASARRPARPAAVAATPRAPTSRQQLECPIDPQRADCRALCTPAATHEWCEAGVSASSPGRP